MVALFALATPGAGQAVDDPSDTEIVVAFGAEPQQVAPTRSSAGVDGYYIDLFYEGLLAVTPDFERVNWLAESWEVVDDDEGLRIAVKIREGVKFHNGDELTAHDYAYAFENQGTRARTPAHPAAIFYVDVGGREPELTDCSRGASPRARAIAPISHGQVP